MNNDMDRHIQQTNDRLLCIKQHLSSPGGFQNAARELLEWCSDARAFQKPFEGSLIACLTVVNQVAAQPGYDLDLGYRLLAVCAAHRDKFSKNSAALLSMWCEDLGRLLLLRHQKNRGPDSAKTSGMHPQLQKQMPSVPPGDPNAGWAPGNQGHGQQSLNVVTTVWGVTNSTQSGPFTHTTPGFTNTTMSTTNYTQQPQGFPGNQMQKAPYMPANMPYRREPGPYARPSGYPPTPNTPGTNPPISGAPSDMHVPQGALSAAALVAAAATATATATATASMVALQDQQQQMNMQVNMNNQYGSPMQIQGPQSYNAQYPGMPGQRHPGPLNMGPVPGAAPGPMKGAMPGNVPNSMYPRRPAPYPNPSQLMHQKRQAQYPNGGQYGSQGPYGGQQQQYPHKPQYPTQQPLPSPTYGPQGMRPAGPPHYTNGQNPYMAPNQYPPGRPPPQGPGFNQFPGNPTQNPNFQGQNFQHSPIPGNPTPPMTPGSVPPYPGQDIKPNMQEFKPQIPFKKEADELRLTFPVRDGVMLEPFRLEHNLAVSNHVFQLRESVYQTLVWRSDLELQLKCFHHEDRQMSTNWPASVTVSVNATPLNIERGENKTSHKPLYLKDVCQPGRNTIQITVTACCCSHLFVLQLVHRPSVRSVLQGLLRKRLLPADHCITKIKRNFSSGAGNNTMNGEDGVEQTAIKVSLKCPITFRRITLPARGQDCKHIQCFDLESYLQLNCERGSWRCPVCNKTALLEGLEIDQYIWGILTNLATTDFEEVTIDPTARWKPVPLKTVKEEEADPCGVNTPWMKAMSPSSMQMPTMNSLDMGPQPSPYSMPPSAQGPPFQGGYTSEGPGNYPHQSPPGDFPAPLSHLPGSENDIEKTMSNGPGQFPPDQGNQHLQHNNHMPQSGQSQPGNHSNSNHQLSHQPPNSSQQNNPGGDCHISDLNFDPTAIIDGDGTSQGLDLPLENLGDPLELLSYLGPSEGSNDPSGGQNGNNTNGNNSGTTGSGNTTDDLLAFFE